MSLARASDITTHRHQHMRRVQRTSRASGTTRSANTNLIHQHQDAFGLDRFKGDISGIWKTWLLRSIPRGLGDFGQDPILELITKRSHADVLILQMARR